MVKNPYDSVYAMVRDSLDRDKKTLDFIYTQTDSLITWLIGFSFTALSLIASNIASIRTNLKSTAKPIIFFFFLTIIAGLVFRYISYLIMIFQKKAERYLDGRFKDWSMMPLEVDSDIESSDYLYIIRRLKDDFNEVIEFPRPLTEAEQNVELTKLIEHYKALCAHSNKLLDLAIHQLAEVDETVYKINKEKSISKFKMNMENPKIGYNYLKWNKTRGILYLLCILFFITAVFIGCIYLLSI